jgi:hypothetical protein
MCDWIRTICFCGRRPLPLNQWFLAIHETPRPTGKNVRLLSVFPWYTNKGYVSTVPKHIETINGDDPRINKKKNRGYFPHIVENLCKLRDLLHIRGKVFSNMRKCTVLLQLTLWTET